MASNFESSIQRGSDLFFDFSCVTCLGNDRNTEAEFYCEDCSKVYCGKCLEYHNFLYRKHATLDKKNIGKWPVSNAKFDVLEQCQVHKDRKLETFCEDHSELMCTVCHIYNHKKCSHVVLLDDKVKDLHQKGEFKHLSATLDTLHGQLIQKKDDFEESMKSLEKSYKKILEEINALRKAINDSLDQLEKNTIKELDTLLAGLRTSIQTDHENCNESIKKMTSVKEDWLNIKGMSEGIQMSLYRKCLDQSVKNKTVLQELTLKNDMTLRFTPDTTIQQTLSTISGLGLILVQENTVTRDTKPEANCTVPKRQIDSKNQTSDTNMHGLVSSPVLGTPRQKADIANETSVLNKPNSISNPISVTHKHGGIAHQTTAVHKPDHVFNPISDSSTQSNIASDVNKPGQMSDSVTSSSHQLVPGYQQSAISKSDPNKVIRVNSSKMYSVKIKRDSNICSISSICATASGELLITDRRNSKVKLLDQTYKVVAHCDLPNRPWSMCSIDSSLVAVALDNNSVHFIRVTNGQLVQDRRLKLTHNCRGIAHYQGNLYITSGTALYHYTVDGRLVSKMHEDTSDGWTVFHNPVASCAVSPDGNRIYVTNEASNQQLLTLSGDGKVISKLTDPALQYKLGYTNTAGIHVTDSGQVLVCGVNTNTIIQVDTNGTQRLGEVVTCKNGVDKPASVYYSKHTGILIVGMKDNNNIMAFSTH